MTAPDLAAAWRSETDARAERARLAMEAGRATPQQAERDAMLCAIVQQLADAGCDLRACPSIGLANDAGINDLADASDMLDAIQARARIHAPDAPRTHALHALADAIGPQVRATMALTFAEHRRMTRGTPDDFTPATPPHGWRIPLKGKQP